MALNCRIKKFLVAFELEAGGERVKIQSVTANLTSIPTGLVIAWFNFILDSLVVLFLFFFLLYALFVDCNEPEEIKDKKSEVLEEIPNANEFAVKTDYYHCNHGRAREMRKSRFCHDFFLILSQLWSSLF
jgi:hypothetical protein